MRKTKLGLVSLSLMLLFSMVAPISQGYAFEVGDIVSVGGIGEGGDASDQGS